MIRKWIIVLFLSLGVLFSFNAYAQQAEDLKSVCELSGGSWTGSQSGNWACCWADWGCYGCHSGICKMQCRTQRCRDANKLRNDPGTRPVKGLVAPGVTAPIAPAIKRK